MKLYSNINSDKNKSVRDLYNDVNYPLTILRLVVLLFLTYYITFFLEKASKAREKR